MVYFSTPSFSPLLYYIFLLSSYRVIEKTANVKPEVQWGLVEGLEETEANDHIMSLSPSLRTYLVVCHPRKSLVLLRVGCSSEIRYTRGPEELCSIFPF